MSDNSSCYFNRHKVEIVINSKNMPTKNPVLSLEVSDGDWEVLSNREFASKLIKAMVLGVKIVFIDGETHKFLKFFTIMLPVFHKILPTVICVDGCKALFLDRVFNYVEGVCLCIKLPVKEYYNKEDRSFFREIGEYRTPDKYKSSILDMISIIDKKNYSILRIERDFMDDKEIDETVSFLSSITNLKIVVSEV